MADLSYLISVVRHYATDRNCPHCFSRNTKIVGRKYIFLQLRKCADCGLMFRFPKDSAAQNKRFYTGLYQEAGLTTNLPSHESLEIMMKTQFKGTNKDFAPRIALLKKYKESGALLDFGASWGYGSWQIQEHGFEVTAFEVDVNRAAYGEKHLELRYFTEWQKLLDSGLTFDVIFTSHVLEHLPEIHSIFRQFYSLLNPNGILQIYVPNCTNMVDQSVFHRKKSFAFGQKHAIAFDDSFFKRNLPQYGFQIEQINVGKDGWVNESALDLIEDPELIVVARKIPNHI